MLRTNSKKARENVMKYIRLWDEDYLEERSTEYGYDISNDNELCKMIYEIFRSETDGDNRKLSEMDMFFDWAQGLALGGLFCYFYNRSAVKDLCELLEVTEEEICKYSEEQSEWMLTYLIFMEVCRRKDR